MGKKSYINSKKIKDLKSSVSKMCKMVAKYSKELELIYNAIKSLKSLKKTLFIEFEKKYLEYESKIDEMEIYYNMRIQKYKSLYTASENHTCKYSSELTGVYDKYLCSLKEMDDLISKIEICDLESRFYKSRDIKE